MNTPDDFVQRAIADLATVRKAIETSGGDTHTRPDRAIIGANLTLQITAFLLASGFLIWELVSGHLNSMILTLSAQDTDLATFSIIVIGTILLLLVVTYQRSVLLSWPLAGFILVCGISIVENLRLTRNQPQSPTAAK